MILATTNISPNVVVTLQQVNVYVMYSKSQEMLLHICLAFRTLNCSSAFFPERLISSVTGLLSSSTSLNQSFLPFQLYFSFWNLEALIIALSMMTVWFSPPSSCGALAHILSHTLTTVFSDFSSLPYFPRLWSIDSWAPGLSVSAHHPSTHLSWMPRCRLKYLLCFVGLKTMSSRLFCQIYILMKQHV